MEWKKIYSALSARAVARMTDRIPANQVDKT
jgi:hypothetical protein